MRRGPSAAKCGATARIDGFAFKGLNEAVE
jgi:hypothetical protein